MRFMKYLVYTLDYYSSSVLIIDNRQKERGQYISESEPEITDYIPTDTPENKEANELLQTCS